VDIHHIQPQELGGENSEENAAPLCGACHDLLGSNPDLRKEIKSRRNHWYEICQTKNSIAWPVDIDVPMLGHIREIPPTRGITQKGIQLTDKDPLSSQNPPILYVSIHFKKTRYFPEDFPDINEKWLHIQADMRFAFSMRLQVRAYNSRDEDEFRKDIHLKKKDKWMKMR
jgi:hypothetical protein